MIYKMFQGLKLSALGFGMMRLPVLDGDNARIDEQETRRMVDYAMAHGVNYYDTAWGYHGGNCEAVAGRALSAYPRESYFLATKFPGYDLSNMGRAQEIFEEQLQRCGVDYFDFYLVHNVNEANIDAYLDRKNGDVEHLFSQKRSGRIRHLGFSAHGSCDVMRRFLEAYGAYMEFCQIQLNYLDWTLQDAKDKVALLKEYGLPVWVMEPLRGGQLAALSEADTAALFALRPDESVPGFAFRFLQSLPEVLVTLSGMSTLEQVEQNIRIYETDRPLNSAELSRLLAVADGMLRAKTLPCTACRYCADHCPQGLDIPLILKLYNDYRVSNDSYLASMVFGTMPAEKRPGACLGCRSCEAVCPQQIAISEAMAEAAEKIKAEP